ncbi:MULTISPECIES: hypothetical protein [unclassified Granulicatella]|uniref:hypothetical protein n=1 Tax=unclassified Granulicatella TaxID=2630493 RepID=UPI001074861E|nr:MULTISPECIES: hypothetical protein [unclassified Granulicatella]MBF0779759.1 hypothetical protein [Granulicatella sp. 19428wC4_WM01]TFU96162.1 hypothetical protein E4T68_01505 [Granulicatella sp. WM01]
MMVTEKEYVGIAEDVYSVDSKKTSSPYQKGDRVAGDKFEIIEKVEDNLENGMQAMAVAPVIDGQVDTSQIVIAYAGTNIWDGGRDADTDIQSIGLGNTTVMLKSSIDYKSILAGLC